MQLFITYITTTDNDRRTRQHHLAPYGFTCRCPKCNREAPDSKDTKQPLALVAAPQPDPIDRPAEHVDRPATSRKRKRRHSATSAGSSRELRALRDPGGGTDATPDPPADLERQLRQRQRVV